LGSAEVTLEEVGERFKLSGAQLRKLQRKCGPRRLYRYARGESVEQCALDACRTAIRNAALSPGDISGIYASTGGPAGEYVLPDLARILALRMELKEIDTIGIGIGCVGGIDCILAARNRLIVDRLEGRPANYLVVCGDQAALTHGAMDRTTAFIFSEGAACFVLSNEARAGFRIDRIGSVSAGGDPFCMRLKNAHVDPYAKFEMEGEAVYEFAIKTALPTISNVLGLVRIPADTYCIFHQANLSILRQMATQADLDSDMVYFDGIREVGNTSGASVMFGLADATKKGYVRQASQVLLGAFGVGLKVGAALLAPLGDPREITCETFRDVRSQRRRAALAAAETAAAAARRPGGGRQEEVRTR
jgi:3-oxoacyl-[acyl-carrier-protein] synthase-3